MDVGEKILHRLKLAGAAAVSRKTSLLSPVSDK